LFHGLGYGERCRARVGCCRRAHCKPCGRKASDGLCTLSQKTAPCLARVGLGGPGILPRFGGGRGVSVRYEGNVWHWLLIWHLITPAASYFQSQPYASRL